MSTLDNHPADAPDFNPDKRPVWYMAHPLMTDEYYTREKNMSHILHLVKLFFSEGVAVVAPYHTIMLALDDDNPADRQLGMETDVIVVQKLGKILCVGHRLSKGMMVEREALLAVGGISIGLVGLSDSMLREWCRNWREF